MQSDEEKNKDDSKSTPDERVKKVENMTFPCLICQDNAVDPQCDFICIYCFYKMCWECMFNYMRCNIDKKVLKCPHCQKDCADTDKDFDIATIKRLMPGENYEYEDEYEDDD